MARGALVLVKASRAAEPHKLRYTSADDPGFTRRKRGKGFLFFDTAGKRIRDKATLERIRQLVIPPAWTDVWISPYANGHLQALGRDARGRKQYLYHARFREHRDANKFESLLAFGEALPRIRSRVRRDLAQQGLSRQRVLATLITLLDRTSIRVGNAEYTRQNNSYGLTTLKDRHATVKGATIRLHFKGKSGVLHDLKLADKRLARIVARCQDLPGQELFQYVNGDGTHHPVDSGLVNEYLREISGEDISAKDFRTWHGTLQAALFLKATGLGATATQIKRNLVSAVKEVAEHLGNRPATCRKYYVHPMIVEKYEAGELVDLMEGGLVPGRRNMSSPEACLLAMLRRANRKRAARSPHAATA